MNRTAILIGFSLTTSALAVFAERDAAACGGCFHPPTQTLTDITDEKMLLAVSQAQSTLYDQILYQGNPTSFAWVLPIHGTVDVGLSADVLFESIDTMTATTITPPEVSCPGYPANCFQGGFGASSGSSSAPVSAGTTGNGTVTVTKAQTVGPYATVQLHSTDATALDNWLAQNGYSIPSDVVPVINAYVSEGFDFLAMKLLPNQGVQSMRPVRVTTPGGSLSLPLRMASVGTGATVGITIWVVSDGRYEPQNFPFYHIDDGQIIWDFSKSLSNYTTLRSQEEATYGGKGWEIESSISLNQQSITNVILSGGQYYSGVGGRFGGTAPPVTPEDASEDYLAVGSPDAGTYQSAEDVRTADIAALFAGIAGSNVRVTRMRSDISHAAMTKDFVLQASSDQSELSNIRNVTEYVNLVCPVYVGCNQVGTTTISSPGTPGGVSGGSSGTSVSSNGGGSADSGVSGGGFSSGGSASSNGGGVSNTGGSLDSGVSSSSGASSGTAAPSASGTNAAGATNASNGNAANNGGGGCAAAPQSGGGTANLGAVAGLLGIALARFVRTRRRTPRRNG